MRARVREGGAHDSGAHLQTLHAINVHELSMVVLPAKRVPVAAQLRGTWRSCCGSTTIVVRRLHHHGQQG